MRRLPPRGLPRTHSRSRAKLNASDREVNCINLDPVGVSSSHVVSSIRISSSLRLSSSLCFSSSLRSRFRDINHRQRKSPCGLSVDHGKFCLGADQRNKDTRPNAGADRLLAETRPVRPGNVVRSGVKSIRPSVGADCQHGLRPDSDRAQSCPINRHAPSGQYFLDHTLPDHTLPGCTGIGQGRIAALVCADPGVHSGPAFAGDMLLTEILMGPGVPMENGPALFYLLPGDRDRVNLRQS